MPQVLTSIAGLLLWTALPDSTVTGAAFLGFAIAFGPSLLKPRPDSWPYL